MRIKRLCFFIFLLLGGLGAKAQMISGRVLSDTTDKPVSAMIITHSGHQTSGNAKGEFNIRVSGAGDTIKVFAIGYRVFFYPVKEPMQDHIVIRLRQVSIMLRDVEIRASRNHKKDSINLRRDYAGVFNYRPAKLTDAFVAPPANVPFAFVNVDLLTILSAITKKSDPTYKLKNELLKDEQADYVATRFNRRLVTRVTNLKGDSLNKFMDKYYPTVEWVKKTNDYDMIQYIKAKAVEFRKGK